MGEEGLRYRLPQHVMSGNLRKPQKVVPSTLANAVGMTASSGHSGPVWFFEGLAPGIGLSEAQTNSPELGRPGGPSQRGESKEPQHTLFISLRVTGRNPGGISLELYGQNI